MSVVAQGGLHDSDCSYAATASPSLREQLEQVAQEATTLRDELARCKAELEQWKREALRLQEVVRRMVDQQKTPREHVDPSQIQLAFERIAPTLLEHSPRPESTAEQVANPEQDTEKQPNKPKEKGPRNPTPHGRALLPEHLPVETIVINPKGLPQDARAIGEDVSWKLGFRRASFYRLKIVRPRYSVDAELAFDSSKSVATMTTTSGASQPVGTAQTQDASQPVDAAQTACDASCCPIDTDEEVAVETTSKPEMTVIQASAPLEVIQRGLPTVDTLAHVIVGKFADGLPFNRQSSMIKREGVYITRSTMCQWTGQAHQLAAPLVTAMGQDACHHANVIATDATGVLVQANERCKKGCFTVYVSNNGHVIFRYSSRNSADEPNEFLAEFKGTVLADATATLDAICKLPDVHRAGCHSHARRYFYKAIATDRDSGLVGLGLYNRLFELERSWTDLTPDARLLERQLHSRPVFDSLVGWCRGQLALVDERTPIRAALFYTLNNQAALERFLFDGRVVVHNNRSELELRRLVIVVSLCTSSSSTGNHKGTIVSRIVTRATNAFAAAS